MSDLDKLFGPVGPRIRPGSVTEYFGEAGEYSISYSSTCAHCQRGTDFPSMKKMMDYVDVCRGCMKLICLHCVGKPCLPWEKQVEHMENQERIQHAIERSRWGCYA